MSEKGTKKEILIRHIRDAIKFFVEKNTINNSSEKTNSGNSLIQEILEYSRQIKNLKKQELLDYNNNNKQVDDLISINELAIKMFQDASSIINESDNDNVNPIMIISIITPGLVNGGSTSLNEIRLKFSSDQNTIDFDINDISTTNGSLSNFTGSESVYEVTFNPLNEGECTIKVNENKFKDNNGNFNFESNIIKFNFIEVSDTTAPVITVKGENPVTVEVGSTYTESGATADGGETVTITGSVDINTIGTYTVTYKATDAAGNTGTATRTVKVIEKADTTAPVITVKGENPVTVEKGSTYTESGATADGGEEVKITGSVDINTVGTYTITYTATDVAGNTGTATRTVKVEEKADTTAPVITVIGENVVTVEVGSTYTESGATADGGETVTITGSVDINTVGTYTVTYTATDAAGNTGTATRTVKVVEKADTTAPVITVKGENPVTVEVGSTYTESGATADGGETVTITGSVDINTVGTYTVTYTATDSAGNTGTATRTVKVVEKADTTAPVITVKGENPVTVEKGSTYTESGATADGGEEVKITGSVDINTVGTYTVTYTATDASGNTGTATRTVKVIEKADTTAPVITVTGDNPVTVEKGSTYTESGATADGGETVTITGSVDINTVGTYTVTYKATDAAGNTGTATRTVKVVEKADTTAPVITLIGENVVTVEVGSTYTESGATADGGETVTITGSVDINTVGTYTVTYKATNAAGNTGTATRTVKVVEKADTTAPVITLIGENVVTVEVGSTYTESGATADGGETVTITGSVDINTVGTYTVTYKATDAAGNTGTATRTVKVVEKADTTAPVITVTGDNPVTVEKGSTYTESGATADGGETVTITGSVDINTVGTYTVTYTATDASGNTGTATRTVKVIEKADTTAPVITVTGDNPVTVEKGSTYTESGATADGGETVTITGSVDINTVGTYTVTYTATDAAGNTGTATRTVKVIEKADTTAPVITVKGDNPVTVEKGSTYTDAGATADGGEEVKSTSTVDINTVGTYTVTYTATDAAGNTATATRTVKVVEKADTTAPVITVTGDNPVTVEKGSTYTDAGATADGTTGEEVKSTSTVDINTVGTYTVTYTATDAAGNTGTATRTVKVVDTTAPVITVKGENPVTVEKGSTYTESGATADGGETVTITGSVDTNTVGTYTVTYKATDAAGNTGTATRTVKVVEKADTTAPVITVTGDNPVTVEKGSTYTDAGATADGGEEVKSTSTVDINTVGTYRIC